MSVTANPVSVTMNANKAVKAVFVQQFTFGATASGQGTIDPSSGVYDANTNLSVTATPASGYRFGYWGGATTGTDNPGTVVMNANKTLTGYFIRQFAMAASVYGQGTVTPSSGLYDEGSYATINAAPAAGWRFHHWAGDAAMKATRSGATRSWQRRHAQQAESGCLAIPTWSKARIRFHGYVVAAFG